MLDNLINPDLSGVSGYIRYDNAVDIFPQMIIAIVTAIVLIGLIMLLFRIVNGTRSKRYRELLSDMYVIGRVKQIAEEDKIDLMSELKKFSSIVKKSNTNLQSIDEVVAMELKEKISDKDTKK